MAEKKTKTEDIKVLDATVVSELLEAPIDPDLEVWEGQKKWPRGTRKKDFQDFKPEVRDKILEAIKLGSPLQYAARFAGISPSTLNRWLERGAMAQARIEEGYEDELVAVEKDFAAFYTECIQSNATVILALLGNLVRQSMANPHVALKLLEKLDPAQFGPRQSIDISGKVGIGHIHVDARQLADGADIVKKLSTEELRLLRSDLSRRLLEAGSKESSKESEPDE